MAEQYKFAAFISYSSKDAAFAKRLHRALEGYGIPNTLGKFDLEVERGRPNRVYPVFRDREELPAGELGERITEALQQSRSLIVVCSPNAAASPWVQKEIETFLALGRRERVYAIIAPNAPLVDDEGADATRLCFPPAFGGGDLSDPNALEPIAADARAVKDGFRNAWLKLVAGMIGVNAGALQDRDRRRRRSSAIRGISVWALAATAVAAAWIERAEWQPTALEYLRYRPFIHSARTLGAAPAFETFQDCVAGSTFCPVMTIIPGGRFMMGSTENDFGDDPGDRGETPVHAVTISRFAAAKYDITFANWQACLDAGGCSAYAPDRAGWKGDNRPVVNISWNDAEDYVLWLSRVTGEPYRLLTESEWEYAARAGTTTKYYWGDAIGTTGANCKGCGNEWNNIGTSPVGTFRPNAFGLYDMSGNAEQWVQDCLDDYSVTPRDGSALTKPHCQVRVMRGGSWALNPGSLTSANRDSDHPDIRDSSYGFRVARTLR